MSVRERVENLESNIKLLESTLKLTKQDLEQIRSVCNHEWSPATYSPEEYKEYNSFSVGSWPVRPYEIGSFKSHLLPYKDDRYTIKQRDRWMRECKVCKKVEYTQKADQKIEKIPKFD
jgi:hypothetical protein